MRNIIIGLIAIGLATVGILSSDITTATKESNSTQENNQSKTVKKTALIVDLDKELKEQESKGKTDNIVYGMLSFGDNNDEVAFVGTMLVEASNTIIVIEDSSGKIKRTITNSLTIKTAWLESGDKVIIKKEEKVILDKEVERGNSL